MGLSWAIYFSLLLWWSKVKLEQNMITSDNIVIICVPSLLYSPAQPAATIMLVVVIVVVVVAAAGALYSPHPHASKNVISITTVNRPGS
uniref:Uncharacterized protein n=1 Tax=Octopus bimaculoides TaxID=37653 RepID=A0A0L8GA12_OCTBM